MRVTLRRVGRSTGVILPKPVLMQLGVRIGDDLRLVVREDSVVLTREPAHPREGWAEAAAAISDAGDDAPVWPLFGNDDDVALAW